MAKPNRLRLAVTITLEFDRASATLVKRHFAILMRFDSDFRLERVQAKEWLTGP